jgi:hypothetical protein
MKHSTPWPARGWWEQPRHDGLLTAVLLAAVIAAHVDDEAWNRLGLDFHAEKVAVDAAQSANRIVPVAIHRVLIRDDANHPVDDPGRQVDSRQNIAAP